MINFNSNISQIDWELAADIFHRAPLGERAPKKLERAFNNSYAYVFAYDNKKLIGMCRAICDGEYQAAIHDLVLLPEYHGKGIGKELFQKLREKLPVQNIILFSAPGREGFYSKCGFKRMLTAMAVFEPRIGDPERGYLEYIDTQQRNSVDRKKRDG
jgi:GNAT superfamily N-acetyltransferase